MPESSATPALDANTKLSDAARHIVERDDVDLLFYAGEISRQGYTMICDKIETLGTAKHRNAGLFLNTLGGDPHAAYRIARALGHHYEQLTLYVFGPCKSAGTLLAIGFNTVVIGNRGELGPMDVQLANREEILEYNSGLDMIQAMDWLQRHAKDSFKDFLADMRHKERLNTKFASETARQLTQGLFSGLYAHMDPVRLGYVQRTMLITEAYGERLNRRSGILQSQEALHNLVYEYPTHEFVIDRSEARDQLFNPDQVRCPDSHENALGLVLARLNPGIRRDIEIRHLNTEMLATQPATASDTPTPAPAAGAKARNPAGRVAGKAKTR
jgi:hypothetical protein